MIDNKYTRFGYIEDKCIKCNENVNRLYGGTHTDKGFLCWFCRLNIDIKNRSGFWKLTDAINE